jgi:long-chain acyl-CoA synthetase
VVNAVVAPIPHQVKGFAPAAMVTLREGARTTADDLKAFCIEKGPLYSHPRHVAVVKALPLNGAGKIDRAAVQAQLAALSSSPSPAGGGSDCRRQSGVG